MIHQEDFTAEIGERLGIQYEDKKLDYLQRKEFREWALAYAKELGLPSSTAIKFCNAAFKELIL